MTIAIIGCGGSGSAIGSQLIKKENVDKIKLIDFNIEKSQKLFNELSIINNKLEFESFQINAINNENLVNIFKDVKVVINAASPVCNIPVMKACIKSNSNYIDLASDPFNYQDITGETSLDSQLALHDKFMKNDIVAVTNAGASPGFSDLLCRHASETNSFDSLEHIKIYFAEIIKSEKLVSSWSPYMLLLESILPATIYEHNKIYEIESDKRHKFVGFPQPFGKIKINLFNGHPELRTIPEFMKIPINHIEVGGGMLLNELELDDIILEALREKVKDSMIFEGDIFKYIADSFESPDSFVENYKNGVISKESLCCLTEVVGITDGNPIKYIASTMIDLEKIIKKNPLATSTSYMVSIVPTILASKIIQDEIIEKGVIAPAALNSASEIVKEARQFDLNFKESVVEINHIPNYC